MPDTYTFGDIYLVRFHPSYGSELHKYRPAVITSGQVNIIDTRFTLICPFTTNVKTSHPKSELVIKNSALKKDSLLLTWYLWTLDTKRLVKKIGQLSKVDKTRLQEAVSLLFT